MFRRILLKRMLIKFLKYDQQKIELLKTKVCKKKKKKDESKKT